MIANEISQYFIDKGLEYFAYYNFDLIVELLNPDGEIVGDTKIGNTYTKGIHFQYNNEQLLFSVTREQTSTYVSEKAVFVRVYILENNTPTHYLFTKLLQDQKQVRAEEGFSINIHIYGLSGEGGSGGGGSGSNPGQNYGIYDVIAGTDIRIDKTDSKRPIINALPQDYRKLKNLPDIYTRTEVNSMVAVLQEVDVDLQRQIDELADKEVDLSSFYTKDEVDVIVDLFHKRFDTIEEMMMGLEYEIQHCCKCTCEGGGEDDDYTCFIDEDGRHLICEDGRHLCVGAGNNREYRRYLRGENGLYVITERDRNITTEGAGSSAGSSVVDVGNVYRITESGLLVAI